MSPHPRQHLLRRLPEVIALLRQVRSAIVIRMHWFSMGSRRKFIAGVRGLPRQPTIMVMPPPAT
jgi:hypothetical protein